jgi:flagellar capping protein FliD
MAAVVERVSVLETKVQHIDEKIDDIKSDIKEVHDCLDRTGQELKTQLSIMHESSCQQHNELSTKIREIENAKNKMMMYGMVTVAFIAGLGWTGELSIQTITKFFGL